MDTIKFVQKNLNYRKDAEELLSVFIREEEISIALVSEPYSTGLKDWFYDLSGEAAIGIFRPGLSIVDIEVGDGFVAATVAGSFRLYSCFAKSSLTSVEFKSFMNLLQASVAVYHERGMNVIIAGDFNAHSKVRAKHYKDTKMRSLRKLLRTMNLRMMKPKRKSIPTSFPIELWPVTLVSNTASRKLRDWKVCTSTENVNDYYYYHITFSLSDYASDSPSSVATGSRRQGTSRPVKTFKGISNWAEWKAQFLYSIPSDEKNPGAKRQLSCLEATWIAAFPPRKRIFTGKKLKEWWNDEIATVRMEYFRLKKKLTKERKRNISDVILTTIENDYQMAKLKFKRLVRKAKAKCNWDRHHTIKNVA